jgi:hypothetical protein
MLKDQKLDEFAQRGVNIAQFVSFAPDGKKRYSRIRGTDPTHRFASVEKAIQAILDTGAPFVNIRCFLPTKPDGNPFFMGRHEKWSSVTDIADGVRALCGNGYHVLINEDININDGGFSGVVMGEIAEFAPMDTPRCVEKTSEPRCAILPRRVMQQLVHVVYQRRVGFPYSRNHRIEFSVHPGPVGYLREPHIMWQEEAIERGTGPRETFPRWPNRYSIVMGDKAYGLLMAHLYGLRVPFTRVTGRIIPPFEFGELTGDGNSHWIRTCPRVQQPGKFSTEDHWVDPFALMQREDPDGSNIAAIIQQNNVVAEHGYSGAAITGADGSLIVEGVSGRGDKFMVGDARVSDLPVYVIDAVTQLWERAKELFGPVRFEWVYDAKNTLWVVQLHAGTSSSMGSIIYPGEPSQSWERYDVANGLEGLRSLVRKLETTRGSGINGVILVGNVGITSHFGDLLRRARIPSRLERTSKTA